MNALRAPRPLEIVDIAHAGGLAERRRGRFAHGERVRSQVWPSAEQVGEPLVSKGGVAGRGDGRTVARQS